jgi:tetratricopeptide (TPR) repeat protein
MNQPHDPNRTVDIPAAAHAPSGTVDVPSTPADSLDAGLAAGFGQPAPPRSSLGEMRPVLLKEAEGDSAHIVKPNSDTMPPPEQTGDRYQLQGEIARGGMGAVLRGRDVDLGRDLAIKVLLEKHTHRPEVARRFIEEAQIGGQLQHPGVVPVYDIGRFGDRPFFTMKLVKGQTLAHQLAERADHTQDRPRFVAIALQVAQTLAYAHAKGVIHRDLKPANIMVGAFGEVQVMDWGLAKVLAEGGIADEERASRQQQAEEGTQIRTARSSGSAGTFGTQTEAGSLLGTPAYMPPEQANGDIAHLDRRADVFGLGAILCEILTGKPPYVGRSSEEVRRRACNGDLADAQARLDACGADAELIVLTRSCLAPEAIDRPRDAQAVADGLSAYLNGVQERLQTAQRERAVALAREAEQRKRRKVQLALAAAVVALLLGGGAFAWWRNEQAQAGRERDARNAEAVAALLGQAEEALKAGDAAKAAVALDAAKKRSQEGGAEKETERLQRLDADLALLRDLDAVDQFRWTWAENKLPDPVAVAKRTRKALARFGADPRTTSVDEAAARVSTSRVRERIVSALDRLLRQEKKAAVHALLRRVDADPYRDAVRDVVLANNATKMADLARRKDALEQPPGFVAFLGESGAISVERRRQLLQAAVSRRPGDLGLLMTLAYSYPFDQRESADERVRWYQAAVAAAPANYAAHVNLGAALMEKRQVEEAIACYKKAIELGPKFPQAHGGLGNALKAKGQVDGAIACHRKAISIDPKYALAHFNLGVALKAKGQVDEAIACHRKAIELAPKFATAHNGLGNALIGKGQMDEAIACFQKAIALDPKNAIAHSNLGNALRIKGQVEEAIGCCKKAIELDPKLAPAHCNLGNALTGKGKVDEAIASYRKAISLDPKMVEAHGSLGNALKAKGQVEEAIACYHKAIKLDPKDARTHNNLGGILYDSKRDYDGAIACFRRAVELGLKEAGPHFNLGVALYGKGQVDEAIGCYRKAIALDPKHANAHNNLGNALVDKGQFDEAILSCRKAIELDPKLPQAHFNLGNALRNKGKVDEAITCIRTAIELAPKVAEAHHSLGLALNDKGKVDEAIASYRQAIQRDPKFAPAHNNLGNALAEKGKVEEAVACWRKALSLDPKLAPAHANLGIALRARGEVDEAIVCLRKALSLDPKLAPAHTNLGLALSGKSQLDEAIACFRTAVALSPKDAQAHLNLGAGLGRKGQLDEAFACYQKAIALKPKYAEAHCNVASVLMRQGRFAESLAAYQRGHELGLNQPGWRHPSAAWVRRAEQLAALEASLPAFVRDERKPRDNAERLALILVCRAKKFHQAAARLYADAFAAESKLADDLKGGHRYNAACSAALAAAGQGADAAKLEGAAKAILRRQALDWLKADLTTCGKLLGSGPPQVRPSLVQTLRHWQQDSGLAGLRDAAALAKLPPEERTAWTMLWADVAALLESAKPNNK